MSDDARFRFASTFVESSRAPIETSPKSSARAEQAAALAWDTPEGWDLLPPTQFRNPNFRLGASGEVECYVSVLPNLGGGLLENVNRWRTQMGLPSLTSLEFDALPRFQLLEKTGFFVSFDGSFKGVNEEQSLADSRLLGVLAEINGFGAFVKMTGPREAVEQEAEAFEKFARSLRMSEGGPTKTPSDNHPQLTSDSMPTQSLPGLDTPPAHVREIVVADNSREAHAQGLAWAIPDSWRATAPRPMRLVTYSTGDDRVECYVTLLGSQAGGVEANLNRWLHQFGRPPLPQNGLDALPTVTMLGQPVALLETNGSYTSMDGEVFADYGLLAVAWVSERGSAFAKLVGPRELVEGERERFKAFCESFRWHE